MISSYTTTDRGPTNKKIPSRSDAQTTPRSSNSPHRRTTCFCDHGIRWGGWPGAAKIAWTDKVLEFSWSGLI